ncbi:DNA repair protein RadA [Candidatus Berkelbacteria bacterium CG_4_9_14_0_2_um_filter_42_30]|uniref:DNA repair protein RadA n=3 Tax=Candidatus Berkelbacteria TaxID=1618330 RepID=A0A2M7K230_9BACT|nr:MAG: DNA repair protein RadA [Candidatus Berkelbacteria bacterium CG1_02_42_45]PIX30289.1 MAG: DNA repair protein RadA [Candidatus Berkelbacteria bacterium CG_4_8_14_3_um_filter_42_13]PJC65688.1 MAG: DNA repair protein RadA [Candidatus Berkelbacteria bacterium CG_4_9_14_0_2_um_filter_42_30]
MAKKSGSSIFVCSNCGNEFSTWSGKCLACGEWNTLKEMSSEISKLEAVSEKIVAKNLSDFKISSSSRIKTGYSEIDRVFGGGIVEGSVILLGGEPGVGKSTLLLQIVKEIPSTLYISGEESPEQLLMRAERLGVGTKNISVSETSDISGLEQAIIENRPKIIVIDSIQTVYNSQISGSAGSQVQVKESGLFLQQLAKKHKIPIIIIGHVTKEGIVAGPRMLEHLVDVVVYMEGERRSEARILRAVKNRFGTTDEIAVLRMGEKGIVEIKNPGALFLSESSGAAGSAVTVLLEGSRPLLVEIQALVTPTTFGYPRRTTSGFDLNRLNILIGIMTKRAGLNLGNQDIYVNVVGGITASEPATDLAVCLAIASSYKNKPLPGNVAYFAEVGLTGEIHRVMRAEKRKKEAENLGYKVRSNYKDIREAIEKDLS